MDKKLSFSEECLSPKEMELQQAVLDIVEKLKGRLISSEEGGLICIDLEKDPVLDKHHFKSVTDNLYDGRSGLALFFAALFHISGDSQWRKYSLECLFELRQKIQQNHASQLIRTLGIGGFAGIGGIIYSLVHCARLLQHPSLIAEAQALALAVEQWQIDADVSYDIISGSAGLVLCLLQLYAAIPDPVILRLATTCGDHLCKKATRTERGAIWMHANGLALLGFSHGTAGIAYALVKLASYTKSAAHLEMARQAMKTERSLFNKNGMNWPDLRPHRSSIMVAWCHGATGVGFGRLASLPFFCDEQMQEEIDIALKVTEQNLFEGDSVNLCCGALGRLELLLEASRRQDLPHLQQKIEEATLALLTHLKQASPTRFFIPGLMKGIAGVGYTLLRLQDKTGSLPQVLLLE